MNLSEVLLWILNNVYSRTNSQLSFLTNSLMSGIYHFSSKFESHIQVNDDSLSYGYNLDIITYISTHFLNEIAH